MLQTWNNNVCFLRTILQWSGGEVATKNHPKWCPIHLCIVFGAVLWDELSSTKTQCLETTTARGKWLSASIVPPPPRGIEWPDKQSNLSKAVQSSPICRKSWQILGFKRWRIWGSTNQTSMTAPLSYLQLLVGINSDVPWKAEQSVVGHLSRLIQTASGKKW